MRKPHRRPLIDRLAVNGGDKWKSLPVPEVIPAPPNAATLDPPHQRERTLAMPQHRKSPPDRTGETRARDLLRLLPLWPHEIADHSPAGHRRILLLLRRALRAERQRGLAGHWTYDLSRHAQLLTLYRAECAAAARASPAPCASPNPSSWPDPNVRAHSSAPPSDSPAADPTSPGTRPVTGCSGSADAASAT